MTIYLLTKESCAVSVMFDGVIGTANGSLSGIKLAIDEFPVACIAICFLTIGKSIHINNFYKMLGHGGSDRLEKTAEIHSLKFSSDFMMYKGSVIAKARQKCVNKEWKGRNQVPGEHLYSRRIIFYIFKFQANV
jgi:hypothetical protein